jgi:carboxypeptidase T
MSRFLSFFFLLFIAQFSFSQDYSRAKIYTDVSGLNTLSDLGIAVDHGSHKLGYFFVSDFSKDELMRIKANGFTVEILIDDVQKFYVDQNVKPEPQAKNANCAPGTGANSFDPVTPANFQLGSMGGFYKYQEMLDNLDLMQQLYPNLISVKAPIDTFQTIESRPIYWVRISDNPTVDEVGEKEILYSAVHHAREPNSMTEVIYYMWYLLENYANSEEIQHLVENCEMYFIPCLNPDGYIYNETTNPNGGGMHRKNRRNVGTSNKGVDLNRNYSYGWNTTGVSSDVNNDTYPGTSAFSEPETQAMKWFCENHEFKLAFNAHTYSDLLLFPIGTTSNEFAVDHDYFNRFTSYMVQHNGFTNMKSSGLYPASGDSDDYMYKVDLSVKPKILAITPEVGASNEGFWPAINKIEVNSKNMLFPNLILAHIAHRYLIVTDLDASNLASATGVFNHEVERIGLDTGAVIVQIQPLQNIATVGPAISYDLAMIMPVQGTFSYTLASGIQAGDTVKYVLETVYPTWTRRDTIIKIFGTLPVVVFDDASTSGLWSGQWVTQSHTFYSPSNAYSDSENGGSASNYPNNTTRTFEYVAPISLVNSTDAKVSFFAKWNIEADYDYCQFQVSTDNGVTWIGQCGNYTVPGTSGSGSVQPNGKPIYEGSKDWVREEISLSDYLGQTIKVRFILRSDGGVNMDGFYFDDFKVSADGTFGLAENELTFKVFPNPVKDYLFISSSEMLTNSIYRLTDLNGKIQKEGSINEMANECKISTNSLSEGVYMLSIVQANGKISSPKKVVVIR